MNPTNQTAALTVEPINFAEVMKTESLRLVIDNMIDGLIADPKDKESVLAIAAEIDRGKTLGQGFGLNEKHLEAITGIAAQKYVAGRYTEAMKFYAFVLSLNQFDARAMKGLAMCHKQLGIAKEALRYFGMSLLIEPEDMESVVMSAECLYQLGMNKEAHQIIRQVLDRQSDPAAQIHKLPDILERARELKKLLAKQSRVT